MIGRRTGGRASQAVPAHGAELPHESLVIDRGVEALAVRKHLLAPGGEAGRLRMPHPAAHLHLARLEVKVAAYAAGGMRGGRVRCAGPRGTGPEGPPVG